MTLTLSTTPSDAQIRPPRPQRPLKAGATLGFERLTPKATTTATRKLIVINLTGNESANSDIEALQDRLVGNTLTEITQATRIDTAMQLIDQGNGSIAGILIIGDEATLISEGIIPQIEAVMEEISPRPVFLSTGTPDQDGFLSHFKGSSTVFVGPVSRKLQVETIQRRLEKKFPEQAAPSTD